MRAIRTTTCSYSCGARLARLLYAVLLVVLAACGGSLGVASRSAQTTETLVATATAPPATATPWPTPTPRPTLTPAPTPTAAPMITTTLTRDTGLYMAPDERYPTVADLKAGDTALVMYRGGEWFSVTIPSSDERGWVPRDAAQLPAGVAATVPPFPEALPIFAGDIVEDAGEGSVTFTGSLRNVGAQEARSVRVLIETLDADGKRVDLIQTSGLGLHIPAGEERSFQVMTKLVDYTTYIVRIGWSEGQPDRASPDSTGGPWADGRGRLYASS